MDHLAASLVAETGVGAADAAALVAEVLDYARTRDLAPTETYAWVRVAARRYAFDTLRAREGGPAASLPEAATAADQALYRIRTSAHHALGELPDEQRAVLRLRYVDGLLPAAIAERLGTTAASVEALLRAARADAAKALHPQRRESALRPLAASVAAAAALATFTGLPGLTHHTLPPANAADRPVYVIPGSDVTRPGTDIGVPLAVVDTTATSPADHTAPRSDFGPGGSRKQVHTTCATVTSGSCGQLPGWDEMHVPLPTPVGDAAGKKDVVVSQKDVPVAFCEVVPKPPPSAQVATCKHVHS